MSALKLRKKTSQELLAELKEAQASHAAILAAIRELATGAQSATISTGGGSRSYTRASLSDLRGLLAATARRINYLASLVTGTPSSSGPRRVEVKFQ